LLNGTTSRKDRRRQAANQRRGIRLSLEALEDRITPTGLVTITESAANITQLQSELKNATAGNTNYIINLTGTSADYNLSAGQELTVSAAASGSSVILYAAKTGTSSSNNWNSRFNRVSI
jgi:hypothetical protein